MSLGAGGVTPGCSSQAVEIELWSLGCEELWLWLWSSSWSCSCGELRSCSAVTKLGGLECRGAVEWAILVESKIGVKPQSQLISWSPVSSLLHPPPHDISGSRLSPLEALGQPWSWRRSSATSFAWFVMLSPAWRVSNNTSSCCLAFSCSGTGNSAIS